MAYTTVELQRYAATANERINRDLAQLERLEEEYKGKMRDQAEAELYLAQGYQAINNQDFEGLKVAVRQLYGLLPEAMAEEVQGYRSTVMKHGF